MDRTKISHCNDLENCYMLMHWKMADLFLSATILDNAQRTLLPFGVYKFAVLYKAGDFHLSPTYFIDGLSTTFLIFIWSFFFLFFLGLLISVQVYRRFFGIRNITISDIALYELNFVANQHHELPTIEHENFLSWNIQIICQYVFNIIISCAFSVFIFAMMSIKTTEDPFHTMRDIATKRTHVLCHQTLPARQYLYGKDEEALSITTIRPEFKGIVNTEGCKQLLVELSDESICKNVNYALMITLHQFRE